jgi:GR25 family glycosyltransferase involved in LPS biosynthesis
VSYTGVYINLDRSTSRRAAMEAQIARHGVADRYRRFPAADGNVLGAPTGLSDSEMGCLISHYLVAKQHLDCPIPLHVVEDDVLFSTMTDRAIRGLVSSDMMNGHDLLFLDNVLAPLGTQLLRRLRQGNAVIDRCVVRGAQGHDVGIQLIQAHHIATSTSYLINPRSTRKLASAYEEMLTEGAREPVDLWLRRKGQEGALRIACVFPFLTSVRLDELETTITGRSSDAVSVIATNLLRHSFFVERDVGRLRELAAELLPPASTDPHDRLVGRLLGCCLDPEFEGS